MSIGSSVAVESASAASHTSTVIKSPAVVPENDKRLSVFLAGTIDMGGSENWQARVERELADENVVLLNPRRDDWNPAWKPTAAQPEFKAQVEWELAALERADIVLMYFAPASQSPVTLLELGLHARSGKVLLACPEGFWRKGNIDITADRYHVPRYETLDALIAAVRVRVRQLRHEN
ncbi:MAG: nucleoside 2-deoxyribosyltransferase domain-containing protein [Rudaea sp.]|uniref:nucleoside 2-deoxyribosyltransferase domain-containing protein n=1 Tax=Rudaea sp. TaxID=2136325 RepID=UPI0039E5A3A2